jgi:hypothetical protein
VKQHGGIVVEASIILPFFICFVLILNSFVQITLTEIALQTAVSETDKQIATHMYPVKLLYAEAKQKVTNSKAGGTIQSILDQIEQTRSKVTESEDFVEQYASFIPDPVVLLLEWEKKQREFVESQGQTEAQNIIDQTFKPLLNKAFTELVLQFADTKVIHPKQFHVVDVKLPDLDHATNALIAIEAQYDIILPIPFFRKTISLRKRSTERIWIGN